MKKTYEPASRDIKNNDRLRELYIHHLASMTAESLTSQCDIAKELAWRDLNIEQLMALWKNAQNACRILFDEKAELNRQVESLRAQLDKAHQQLADLAEDDQAKAVRIRELEAQSGEAVLYAVRTSDRQSEDAVGVNAYLNKGSAVDGLIQINEDLPHANNWIQELFTSPPAAKVPDYSVTLKAMQLFSSEWVGQEETELWKWAYNKAAQECYAKGLNPCSEAMIATQEPSQ